MSNPFSYADPPNLGDKRDPNYNGNAPTFGYNYPPHPPFPPGPIWNDTEYAWMGQPGKPCCPDDSSACLCITSADTSAWDSVYNTVSANSGTWGGDLSDYSAAWQSTYYDVSANSARWNSAANLNLTDISARWESAFNAYSACKTLVDTYSGQSRLYANSPLSGDGTTDTPFGLEQDIATKVSEAYRLVNELIRLLYNNPIGFPENAYLEDGKTENPSASRWLSKNDFDDWTKSNYDSIRKSAVWLAESDAWLWEALRQLSGSGKGGSSTDFVYVAGLNADNAKDYYADGKIYFNEG